MVLEVITRDNLVKSMFVFISRNLRYIFKILEHLEIHCILD